MLNISYTLRYFNLTLIQTKAVEMFALLDMNQKHFSVYYYSLSVL